MTMWADWSSWGLASYVQGYESRAKQETLYYGRDNGAGISDLAIDLGQYAVNQTVSRGATWHFESSPASRFNVADEWCVEIDATFNNATTGYLFAAGPSQRFSLRINESAGIVRARMQIGGANVTVATLTLPGITGSDERFLIGWSAEPNDDTTGSSNVLRHELYAFNKSDGSFDKVVAVSAAKDSGTGAITFWAQTTTGTSPFGGTPHACRFGKRFHSATESAIDFVDTRAEPATEVDTSSEHEGLPLTTAAGIHGRDNFHGPAAVWAVDKTKRLLRRLLTPLYNKRFRNHHTWTDAELTAANAKIRGAPGAPDYRMHLGWLEVAPVPDTCTHLWVRIHCFSRASSGSAVPVGVRFYSMNRPPGGIVGLVDEVPAEAFDYHHVTDVITRDDEVGVTFGEWDLEALVPIARGTAGIRKGKTYLGIALQVDPAAASTNDANAQIVVRGCHAVPCFVSSEGSLSFAEMGG